jgi:thiol:disulfide interchange protein DsbC
MSLKSLHLLASLLAVSLAAQAQTNAQPAPAAKTDPRADIVKKIDGLKLEDVRMTPVQGIYEITRGSEISYTTSDGRYVILGDMVDIDADQNLSENRRRTIRQRLIDTVPESEMLVFGPKNPKYTITVFTDIVKRDWELGHKLGIEGTPAIFLASGEMLPGYAPPATLLQYLKTGKM